MLLRRLLPGMSALWIPTTWLGMTLGMAIFLYPGDWLDAGIRALPQLRATGLFHPLLLLAGLLAGLALGGGQALLLRQWNSGLAWLVGSGLGAIFLFPSYHGVFKIANDLLDTPFTGRFFSVGVPASLNTWVIGLWLVQGAVCGAMYALPLCLVGARIDRSQTTP